MLIASITDLRQETDQSLEVNVKHLNDIDTVYKGCVRANNDQ
jgi:hypothetical protein